MRLRLELCSRRNAVEPHFNVDNLAPPRLREVFEHTPAHVQLLHPLKQKVLEFNFEVQHPADGGKVRARVLVLTLRNGAGDNDPLAVAIGTVDE